MRRLVPLVLLAALVVGCASSPTPATPPPLTTQPPTTTMSAAEKAEREAAGEATKPLLKELATTSNRPSWCSFYYDWKQAGDTMANIGRTHGSNVTTWPSYAYKRWERALATESRAGGVLWDGTEAGTVPRGWDARARACR